MNVLVVDDDPDVRDLVQLSLAAAGHHVTTAEDAQHALEFAGPLDVAILDVQMPGMSGLDLLVELRRRDPDLHVMMLTAAGSEHDRVLGLVSGADDYLVKPVSMRELAARLEAVDRRRRRHEAPMLVAGDIRIDTAANEVWLGERRVEVTRRELELLRHLASHPRQVFSRGELLRSVWKSSSEWQSEATVTEHIRRLRTKLERDPLNPQRLLTVRGVGYRFQPVDDPPSAPVAEHEGDVAVAVVAGTTMVHVNDAMVELLGVGSADDLIGRDVFEYVAEHSVAATAARHEGVRAGTWTKPELLTVRRHDWSEVHVEVASAIVDWQGSPASEVRLRDVTNDSAKLRELATGIRTDVADAVIVADTDLRIQSVNPAAEALYGWREDEIRGRRFVEVLPLVDIGEEAIEQRLRADGWFHGELVQRGRDGGDVRVHASMTLLRDRGGSPVGVIAVNRPIQRARLHRASGDTSGDAVTIDELRRAIAEDALIVHYQPIVDLADDTWHHVEALVRWQHPQRGLLPPSAFIGMAERSGAINELGDAVMRTACGQVARWHEAGHDIQVSVNLSTRQLSDPALPDRIARILEETSMPPGVLWLEVTETALVADIDVARDVLRRIDGLGVCVAIDDFGTGWASLTYLREFVVHGLKIDRSFVAAVQDDPRTATIVGSMISLGAELGLAVVAEGVETPAQRAQLRDLGCPLAQGFHFGRPAPAEELRLDGWSG